MSMSSGQFSQVDHQPSGAIMTFGLESSMSMKPFFLFFLPPPPAAEALGGGGLFSFSSLSSEAGSCFFGSFSRSWYLALAASWSGSILQSSSGLEGALMTFLGTSFFLVASSTSAALEATKDARSSAAGRPLSMAELRLCRCCSRQVRVCWITKLSKPPRTSAFLLQVVGKALRNDASRVKVSTKDTKFSASFERPSEAPSQIDAKQPARTASVEALSSLDLLRSASPLLCASWLSRRATLAVSKLSDNSFKTVLASVVACRASVTAAVFFSSSLVTSALFSLLSSTCLVMAANSSSNRARTPSIDSPTMFTISSCV
mmetsp:Transcript_69829/g.152344  ORF Transcript_69829/g.152344 Transcript_69829/m.152344 type:complete len:317 (+) Transcript_69829:158-1108(+)